ncbi:MAG: histidine kinase [Burkholderiaceae bacterium]|nr:histidine kinase [Burkholderiaceae bacterium]
MAVTPDASLLQSNASAAASAAAGPPPRFSAAFRRVANLRTVALTFYTCLLFVIANWFPMAIVDDTGRWASMALVSLRQHLISGFFVLTAIAVVRGWSARRGSEGAALLPGVLAVALAAGASCALRLWMVDAAWSSTRWPWFVSTVLLWTLIGGLAYALVVYVQQAEQARCALADQACARETLNAQVTQAHLSALQAQIEPHFLFNTLANVKRLYETAPERGRDMLSSLIGYLRAALPGMRRSGATVAQELDLARAYLTILQMRMGERLAFTIDAPAQFDDAEMPPLVLGTLLENAIKHGLGALPEGGRIDIRVSQDTRHGAPVLRLDVADTGAGFSGLGGSGVGLANTRSRLAALYGDAAALTLATRTPRGVVATVVLPLRHVTAVNTPLQASPA